MGGSGSKKKSNKEDANVGERKHPYEECNPSENDDDKPDPGKECKVVRAPRQYEEIDKDFEQDKANAKESNNTRLSQKVAYPSYFLKRRYPGDECLYLI